MSKSGEPGELDGERSARNERNSTARTRFNGRDFNGRRKRSGAAKTVERTRRPAPLQNPLTLFYYKRKILQSGRRTISALSFVFRAKRRRRRRRSDFLVFFFTFCRASTFFRNALSRRASKSNGDFRVAALKMLKRVKWERGCVLDKLEEIEKRKRFLEKRSRKTSGISGFFGKEAFFGRAVIIGKIDASRTTDGQNAPVAKKFLFLYSIF